MKMSEIKLEVGKTYRNRRGEEVRIVRKGNADTYPYQGSDDEWYAESGRFDIYIEKSRSDLVEELPEPRHAFTAPDDMKEVTSTRYTFTIPGGVTKLTVEQVGNRIVVEMVPEKGPKPGDVMINEEGSMYIFKKVVNKYQHWHYAWLGKDGRLTYNSLAVHGRPATPEEAQPLWDALKKVGKRWNSETMQVEDVSEIDRIREWAMEHYSNCEGIAEAIEEYLKYREESATPCLGSRK